MFGTNSYICLSVATAYAFKQAIDTARIEFAPRLLLLVEASSSIINLSRLS